MNEWTHDPAFRFRKKELRGPDPVGAKGMRLLHQIGGGLIAAWWLVSGAPRLFERLRRSGYVEFSACKEHARITVAGRALLGQQPSDDTKSEREKV